MVWYNKNKMLKVFFNFFLLFSLVGLFFVCITKPTLAATNLLTNPGHETGDNTGWTASGASVRTYAQGCPDWPAGSDAQCIRKTPNQVYEGEYSLHFSYTLSSSYQNIDLTASYSVAYLDTAPSITVTDHVIGTNYLGGICTDTYRWRIILKNGSGGTITSYDTGNQSATCSWQELTRTFSGYGTGLRTIYFERSGQSTEFVQGAYGSAFDGASVYVGDTTAPTISSLSPLDNATGVGLNSNLVMTFSENVTVQTGNITIKKSSDDSTVETIDVTSGRVTGGGGTTITINPDTTFTENTNYYILVEATAFDDTAGNGYAGVITTTTWNFTTTDLTAPVISDVTSIPANTQASITWNTNEASSSLVEYGLHTNYGLTTTETDTAPRVTSHSVTLTSLKPCGRYFFRVKSTDASSNQTVSSQATFTTTGCTTSSVTGGNESHLQVTGGSVSLANNLSTATITAPNGFVNEATTIQINKLNTTNLPNPPSNFNLVTNNFYDFLAVNASHTQIDTFLSPVTFTLNYGSDTETDFEESTLDVYKYVSGWIKQNCGLNTQVNTLTCSLGGFSTYAVLGTLKNNAIRSGPGIAAVFPKPLLPEKELTIKPSNDTSIITSREIAIRLNADPITTTGFAVSFDPNLTYASIEKYKPEIFITLPKEPGVYTLYLKYYSPTGHSSPILSQLITYKNIEEFSISNSEINSAEPKTENKPTIFTRSLKQGMRGKDVQALQKFLNGQGIPVSQKGPGSIGQETEFFGFKTQTALRAFQVKNKIDAQFGVFDLPTKEWITSKLKL